jgi:BioD-like phosphotransacetylase family protein
MCAKAGRGKDALIIEGGSELWHGASVHLDAISVTKHVGGKLVLIVDGEDYDILDDVFFIKRYLDTTKVKFAGIIINKAADVGSFKKTYLADLKKEKVNVLGIIPRTKELSYYKAKHLLDHILAKNLTGIVGMEKTIKSVFIGDMSENDALAHPAFKTEGKMVVTSGDRSDMILAAIETGSSCVLLTNGYMPHANIISKAVHAETPMFLMPSDTYHTAVQLEHIEPLLTRDDKEKEKTLKDLVGKNVKVKELL